MKAVLTVGVPASGKSTKYKDFNGVIINRDDIRKELFGWPYKFTKKREQDVTERQWNYIKTAAQLKVDIAITDTNLNKGCREVMVKELERLGYEVELDIIDCSYELAVKQDLLRNDSVGSDVIWRFFKKYQQEFGIQPEVQDQKLEGCYIFDIDGTLAIMKDRGPFEWEKVGNDLLNIDVWRILGMIRQCGFKVFIFTGRDSSCMEQTKEWLDRHGLGGIEFYMRPEGSQDKDFLVKHEMYKEHIKDKYKVLGVFDDRPQVCRLWNLLGLPLFKVGDQQEF